MSKDNVFCAAVDVPNVPQLQTVQLVSQDTSSITVLALLVLPTVKLAPMATVAPNSVRNQARWVSLSMINWFPQFVTPTVSNVKAETPQSANNAKQAFSFKLQVSAPPAPPNAGHVQAVPPPAHRVTQTLSWRADLASNALNPQTA